MAVIFDGKLFAQDNKEALKIKVMNLKMRGISPKLATILASGDKASALYLDLKQKAAWEIGIEVEIYKINNQNSGEHIVKLIRALNLDSKLHGVMVQLPLPARLREHKEKILGEISIKKDVDGLRQKSSFVHPTAKAVVKIIKAAEKKVGRELKIVKVVGASGMVGRATVLHLRELGYKAKSVTRYRNYYLRKTVTEYDVIVSATGKPGLIEAAMVKKGSVVIDVGSPVGDVVFEEVVKKASFITPVPGGVGPATIDCLLENLLEAAYNRLKSHTSGKSL